MRTRLMLIYKYTICRAFTAMQLTQHTDYAFRVLLYVQAHPERLVTITEIAEYYRISRSHLAKVVANLTQHGYLIGVRGQKRSEEHTSELQSRGHLVCRLLLEKKKTMMNPM